MEFRIKHLEGIGYFAQVSLIRIWHTIGKHTNGFGLYPEDYIDYPLESEKLAIERCENYKTWKLARESKPKYIYI